MSIYVWWQAAEMFTKQQALHLRPHRTVAAEALQHSPGQDRSAKTMPGSVWQALLVAFFGEVACESYSDRLLNGLLQKSLPVHESVSIRG